MRYLWAVIFNVAFVLCVDQGNFKICEQSSFCKRLRNFEAPPERYYLNLSSLLVTDGTVTTVLQNKDDKIDLIFVLSVLKDGIFRMFVDELNPVEKRYVVNGSLKSEPQLSKLIILERTDTVVVIETLNENRVKLESMPFRITFFQKNSVVVIINGHNMFEVEHLRNTSVGSHENVLSSDDNGDTNVVNEPNTWTENFKSHLDTRSRGPEAISVDMSFPNAAQVYGIPEHADSLALRTTTKGLDPYRLYNLDVFEYEVHSTMALYGAIPLIYAHSKHHTVGVFWHNSAETWIDVTNSKDANVVSSIVNLVSGQGAQPSVDVHWISESGVVDFFVLMGPTMADVAKQYVSLTGPAPLPPYFTLGYHQSRWNYKDETDVYDVIKAFDDNNIPVDVIWLDIEYTDGKKYFTWDPVKFSNPDIMVTNLTNVGRKLVVIIDPHVKRESGYFLHEDALSNDYYVKNSKGEVYEGWCWPGSSSYPDFFDPRVQEYYKDLYSLQKFDGTSHDVLIWNDMNEPSVFNGPEITMPKDCVHFGGWEHRHVHNLYGLYYINTTYQGLLERSPSRRPFILTRSFFAGSQRYAAMWTGDNMANWEHLRMVFPMCLSMSLAGYSFCGADVGGFFSNPDEELLQRWYQLGLFVPFYRAHSHIDTKRREPYLYFGETKQRITKALQLRYATIPLWYTLFWEHQIKGEPVIRPLVYNYPEDERTFEIDDQLLIGNCILAKPVIFPNVRQMTVYLPGGESEYWYDMQDYKKYTGVGDTTFDVNMDKIPSFYRGGSIIFRKDRPRRSSNVTHDDPYTIYVALDVNGKAAGTLYIDDGQTFEYRDGRYIYMLFEYEENILKSAYIDRPNFETEAWIEKIVILGAPKGLKYAKSQDKEFEVSYEAEMRAVVVRKPNINIASQLEIRVMSN